MRPVLGDKDEMVKVYPEATRLAIEKGLPAVVFGNESPIATEKLPDSVKGLIDLVKQKGGAK